jgi:hypothetical protein
MWGVPRARDLALLLWRENWRTLAWLSAVVLAYLVGRYL